jgi:hypothetical protein
MPQQHLRGFGHHCTSKGITLIRPEVMTVPPPATDEFFKIGACIQILVVWRQIVEELGRSVDTCRCKTNPSIG